MPRCSEHAAAGAPADGAAVRDALSRGGGDAARGGGAALHRRGPGRAAIRYWQRAGQRALQGSAHAEAIAHLRQGPGRADDAAGDAGTPPAGAGPPGGAGSGVACHQGHAAPEVERAYARARELCAQLGDTPQLFPVLRGLMVYYQQRGDVQTASQLGEQLLRLAQAQPDPAPLLLAHQLGKSCSGGASWPRPRPTTRRPWRSMTRRRTGLAVRYGIDLGVSSQLPCPGRCGPWAFLTRPCSTARRHTLAEEVAHPFSLVQALVFAAIVHQCRREVAAHAQAAAAMTLATEQGFAQWVAWGTVLHGWALAMQGQGEAGLAAIRQGLAAEPATGATLWQPYFLGLLAEAYGAGGHPDAGLTALAEALAVLDTTELRYYAAELSRLKGPCCCSRRSRMRRRQACFHQALDVPPAAGQIWELRAATSLARLWRPSQAPSAAPADTPTSCTGAASAGAQHCGRSPGQAPGRLRPAGAGVRVVHRGL